MNAQNKQWTTALQLACLVDTLIFHGANVNIRNTGNKNTLHWITNRKHLKVNWTL